MEETYCFSIGNYNIELIPFDISEFDKNKAITTKVFSVNLAFIGDERGINSAGMLNKISSSCFDFLENNPETMLFIFCDMKNDNIPRRHSNISPQYYRSLLFSRMFERTMSIRNRNDYINLTNSYIWGGENFINLIAHRSNGKQLNIFSEAIQNL
jgi:hypothetical protein